VHPPRQQEEMILDAAEADGPKEGVAAELATLSGITLRGREEKLGHHSSAIAGTPQY